MLKVVLDTNVIVSGLISVHGPSFELIRAWHERQYVLLTCNQVIDEIERVLSYKKIAHKYNISTEIRNTFLAILKKYSLNVTISEKLNLVAEDPDDDKFLECALLGKADYVISGDSHLLDIKNFDVPIVTIKKFLVTLNRKT